MNCRVPDCGHTATVVLEWDHPVSRNVLVLLCAECSRAAATVHPDLVVARRLPPPRRHRQRPA